MKTHWNLFIASFRVGMLGFGGGPASIPLFEKEIVDKYKWMDEEEFGDVLAIGNTLPGPIATKIAGYIGYRVSGIWGMLNAIFAHILPTIVLMIILLTFLSQFRDFDWVQGMTAAVIPVVGMMMAALTWMFIRRSGKGLGWKNAIYLGVIVFIVMEVLQVHPGIVIAILLSAALLIKDKQKKEARDQGGKDT